jgi:hypothetical protein
VGFDVQLWAGSGLQPLATPTVATGLGLSVVTAAERTDVTPAWDLQLGAEIRLVALDGLLTVWARPLGFSFYIRDGGAKRYDLVVGAQLNL